MAAPSGGAAPRPLRGVAANGKKFGRRRPSLRRRLGARGARRRALRHSLGLKVPCGRGWMTDPRRAARNRVYNRATVRLGSLLRRLFR